MTSREGEVFAGAGAESAKDESPDVEIAASFSAESVRHLTEPRVRFSADGEPRDETVRENLPQRVEPGQVYRDVRLRRSFGARLKERGDGA
jgi:hypothetical protein